MSRTKLGVELSKTLRLRIPGEWWRGFEELSDTKNPMRDIVRMALRRFLVQNKKLDG